MPWVCDKCGCTAERFFFLPLEKNIFPIHGTSLSARGFAVSLGQCPPRPLIDVQREIPHLTPDPKCQKETSQGWTGKGWGEWPMWISPRI